ncbi:PEP-CTERM sorting domain-containing protein [bacterium]|nr:PEP-CTERM sorting domain-containing protein [bacterium]
MRKMMLVAVLLLIACSVGIAYAGTYELTIPAAGYYYGSARYFNIDFGREFTSISGMSIEWSGAVYPGYYYNLTEGFSGPWGGMFYIGINGPSSSTAWDAGTSTLGTTTYPSCESFSQTDAFEPFDRYNVVPWDFLLDGKGTIYVEFVPSNIAGGATGTNPYGILSSAKLILDATVPEPSSIIVIMSGILACGFSIARRKKA